MGEYTHSIDAKGRVIVPAKFREALGNEFIVTKGLDGCLFVFPHDTWTEFEAKLNALPMTDKKARHFARYFLRGAMIPDVDRQGRILIPATLREAAGLEKEAVMIGVGNRIEIWDPKRLEEDLDFEDMDEQKLLNKQYKMNNTLKSIRQLNEQSSLYELLKYRMINRGASRSLEETQKLDDLVTSEISIVASAGVENFEVKKNHQLFQAN